MSLKILKNKKAQDIISIVMLAILVIVIGLLLIFVFRTLFKV